MTTCDRIAPQLTAYLDGELADADGSAVRGHLRACAACRLRASDEAALRDALRVLPPVDPPASLWAGVQAQLAAAEVADAQQPRWRRVIARWAPRVRASRWLPSLPQLALASAVAAAAIGAVAWRAHRPEDVVANAPSGGATAPGSVPDRTAGAPGGGATPRGLLASTTGPTADADVTADLAGESARVTASYGEAIEDLSRLATDARARWTDEQRAAFDARVAALTAEVDGAGDGRPRQRAQRALIRFLQGAMVRDEVVLASGAPR